MRVISTLSALFLALGACSSGVLDGSAAEASAKAAAPAVHPVSGLPVIDLAVKSKGKTHCFRVEVAATQEQQAKGLMFRTEMGADEGMLFPEETPRRPSFWMKNTVIPLDIIYVGTDNRILNIVNALPYDLTPLPSEGVAIAVLELNGGRAAQLGIKPGDKVTWKLPK
ncbi:uncharacterized membrane protein (UPF0127 family) [Novosphingobium chloroacetimidivorans]|uniref:Uncharacterized membrane protein (UPF0127 family) n=1 Tax=Novosphingobium chloroacetimidivorans TaxID=1428314 RepID=A0A7W7NXA9_9SPHN|nr:DUF192 domain-containing protein [Novosphingobium chloroacetimidivorans]MBB4860211.1 uncharacterized membrane protein (UPF0127 family) [Novosphingobium chloroacetimidivorans]